MSKKALTLVNIIGIICVIALHYLMVNFPYAFSWIVPVVLAVNLGVINVGYSFGKDE